MKKEDFAICAYCPKLCRHVCPIAVGTARESTTPTAMMTGVLLALEGSLTPADGYKSAALCTSCGACTEACLLDRPVRHLLAEARSAWGPRPAVALSLVEGSGGIVAVECDDRRWAEALALQLHAPIARYRTTDHLGQALLDQPAAFETHAAALRDRLAGRTLVVSCQACASVADAARIRHRHLAEVAAPDGEWVHHPCHGPRLDGAVLPNAIACCGAAEPFASVHPEPAREVARWWARALGAARLATPDTRCAGALRRGGARVRDPVDALLAR